MDILENNQKFHFVLVHGACHGAWCWYKLTPLLEASGHHVIAVDLAASGIDMRNIDDVASLSDYSSPLIEIMENVIPKGEKVVLVGHSLGGLSLALVADRFPEKVAVAVFVAALLPDTEHNTTYVFEFCSGKAPPEAWMDTKFEFDDSKGSPKSFLFGSQVLVSTVYHLSPIEDIKLAKALLRPAPFLIEPSETAKFSIEGYGSVPRAYIVCKEDKTVMVDLQHWMIENAGVKDVKEIDGADHMPMFSKPRELCDFLLEIAANYP